MIKHNKKKNSFIVYEQLVTLMTNLLSENKTEEFSIVEAIVMKHYNKNSCLLQDKKLIESLLTFKNKESDMAQGFLDEVLVESSFIPFSKLEDEKVALINEITSNIGVELFSIPVKSYKLSASIQFLLNEIRTNLKHSSAEDRVKLKKLLIENIKKVPEVEEELVIDNLTLKILKEKYIKKYSSLLNEKQQEVLVQWNQFLITENKEVFVKYLNSQLKEINEELSKSKNVTSENTELINEAVKATSVEIKEVSEEQLYEIMRYLDVVEDLKLEESSLNE